MFQKDQLEMFVCRFVFIYSIVNNSAREQLLNFMSIYNLPFS